MDKRIKKGIAIGATILTLGGGGAVVADQQINPYTEKTDRLEMPLIETLPEAGESKIELLKDRPEMRLKKWNGEVDLGVAYTKVKSAGSRALLTNRMEWKSAKEEVHAYPIDNENFEFEIILKSKPNTNRFEFAITGYENLDFFYQPELTPEELDQGDSRPENVVGSYAVYHKTKKNYKIGETNYATGKAFHIYRPKAVDVNNNEVWAELQYQDGILSVTVPQSFLNSANYPVRVDPTFGYIGVGATTLGSTVSDEVWCTVFAAPASGTITNVTTYASMTSGSAAMGNAIYDKGAFDPNNFLSADSGDTTVTTTAAWATTTVSQAISGSTSYGLCAWINSNNGRYRGDNVGGAGYDFDTGNTFETYPATFSSAGGGLADLSIYATYTVSGGGGSSNSSDNFWDDI